MPPDRETPPGLPPGVDRLIVGDLSTNCYLLPDYRSGRVALIDPGADGGRIVRHLAAHRLTPTLILLTHGHADHCSGLPDVLASYPDCVVAGSPTALSWMSEPAHNLSSWLGRPFGASARAVSRLQPGAEIAAGGLRLRILAVPGHTPGCYAYYAEAAPGEAESATLFSGDALFRGSVGRTDLPGGSWRLLASSLRKLAELPPATVVLPGHGGPTSIRRECEHNEYLRAAIGTKPGG